MGVARTVLAYSALPAELNMARAIELLRERGIVIAYPRIANAGMLAVHTVSREADLVPGPFGLLEPAAGSPRLEPAALDAAIVPALAYDVRGFRLGYGGGYYDRLLPALRRDCVRIGAIFDEQLIEEVPVESHDQRVDAIVTPRRVIRIPARGI